MQLREPQPARTGLSGQRIPPSRGRSRTGIAGRAALLCLMFLAPAAWGEPVAHCADFLAAQQQHKPPALEWVGCAEGHDHQLRALVATYRVPGAQAAAVERYLVRHTGMAPLRFVCCGWEPRSRRGQPGQGRLPSPAQQPMRVDMHSGETLVTRRGDWSRIPWFEVSVTLPLESP